jgi:putative 4-mercaptohistidine N1-methyltranferase
MRASRRGDDDAAFPENPLLPVAAQEVRIGKPHDFPTFGWDNEYGGETRRVDAFRCSRYLISNGEFLAFVKAGAYLNREYWSDEGWQWRSFRNTRHPAFWVPEGPAGLHRYKLRTVFEIIDMQRDWPACVNFHEAKAYCAWRTRQEGGGAPYRLLTEAEHHAIRGDGEYADRPLSAGGEFPVDAPPVNAKGFGNVFGNLWQWCEDVFHPLPGFRPHPYYDDFSVPCFDGAHRMIMGGSFISTGDEAGPFARFHFRPHFFQHAGFRIVRPSGRETASPEAGEGFRNYENPDMLNRYMLMHWGADEEIYDARLSACVAFPQVAHLPVRCAEIIGRFAPAFDTALDLGCAVGRASFELARSFKQVTGVDFSHEFVRAADALKREGRLEYRRRDQGDEHTPLLAQVDVSIDRDRVHFAQGDACRLPAGLRHFDAVLLANVLCRLPDPAACLKRMQGENALVKPGGILVMTTPFSWLEEYTAREFQLKDAGAIGDILTEFALIHEEEIPFMIREHRRKFEYIVTRATVWRRRVV